MEGCTVGVGDEGERVARGVDDDVVWEDEKIGVGKESDSAVGEEDTDVTSWLFTSSSWFIRPSDRGMFGLGMSFTSLSTTTRVKTLLEESTLPTGIFSERISSTTC